MDEYQAYVEVCMARGVQNIKTRSEYFAAVTAELKRLQADRKA